VASSGVRVAAAALEKGWDISGSLFILSGEPVTDAKRRFVESAGVRVHTMYWISEIGPIGWSCSQMNSGDSVHLLRDSLAVIPHQHTEPRSGIQLTPLLFTTLLPCASNLLINADMGDCATIEPAHCECCYSAAGFCEQLRAISSHAKLTGQGMTLAGTDIERLLEEVLPARFGGAPGDFQLVEQEGPGGTSLVLRVHPRLGVSSTDDVRSLFLRELRRCYGGSLASRVWEHTGAVTVAIAEPVATSSGKVLSLHLLAPEKTGQEQAQIR
jgi:hypothetical protein